MDFKNGHKKKLIFRLALVLGILSFPLISFAGNTKSFVVPQKVVQITNPYISVIGVPVSNLGLSYYFSVEDESIIAAKVERYLEQYNVEPIEEEASDETPQEIKHEDKDLTTKVETLFLNECNNCHNGSDPERWTILKDEKLNKELTPEQWWVILDKVDGQGLPLSKVMPKNGNPLEDHNVQLIRDYVRSLPKSK